MENNEEMSEAIINEDGKIPLVDEETGYDLDTN